MRGKAICISIFIMLLVVFGKTPAQGATLIFDFDSGLDPNFTVFNGGGLFTVDTGNQNLRIFKPADDGTINPSTSIFAGITSVFAIDGDFTITVDFTLDDFPFPPIDLSELRVNQSFINISSQFGRGFLVRRFRIREFDRIGVFANPEGSLGTTNSNLMIGRYQISRSGGAVTGSFALPGSSTFTPIASVNNFLGSVMVQLEAAQGRSITATSRSITSLDISFDNLVIEADQIINLIHIIIDFSTFNITEAKVKFKDNPNDDKFMIKGEFVLGEGNNGIDPIVEDVTINVGTSSLVIPAPYSFEEEKAGVFKYKGIIDSTDVEMKIKARDIDTFDFKIKVTGYCLDSSRTQHIVFLFLCKNLITRSSLSNYCLLHESIKKFTPMCR